MKICEKSKVEICFGLEGQELPNVEMLVDLSADPLVPSGRCPFSGQSAGPTSRCPFSGKSSAKRSCFSSGLEASPLILEVDSRNASAPAPETVPVAMGGRILGNALQQKLDKLTEEDPDLCCPVSLMVFNDPVIASDGFIYDKTSLLQLLANKLASPMTREVLKPEHRSAQSKLVEATRFRKQRSQELVDFAVEAISEQQKQLAITALDRACEYIASCDPAELRDLVSDVARLYTQLGRPVPASLHQGTQAVGTSWSASISRITGLF